MSPLVRAHKYNSLCLGGQVQYGGKWMVFQVGGLTLLLSFENACHPLTHSIFTEIRHKINHTFILKIKQKYIDEFM